MSKSQEMLKLTSFCHNAVRVEVYKAQTGFTHCYNCQKSGHVRANCFNLPVVCGADGSPSQGLPGKGQCSIDTNMLPLQVGGRRGSSAFSAIEAAVMPGMRCEVGSRREHPGLTWKVVVFQPHHPWTVFRGGPVQQHSSSYLINLQMHKPAPPQWEKWLPRLPWGTDNKYQVSQTPNINSSSLNDVFRVVAMLFQQIMAELSGAKSEETE
jgi:hypothetical protein